MIARTIRIDVISGKMNHLRALKVTRYAAVLNLRRLCTKVERQEPLWANMNVEEFGSSRDKFKLIDVREPEELRYHGCFNGAINIPRMSVCLCLRVCVYLYGSVTNYCIKQWNSLSSDMASAQSPAEFHKLIINKLTCN